MALAVEVIYALPQRQVVVPLTVPDLATVRDAIDRSGLLRQFPEIDLERCGVGVFGAARTLDAALSDGDRVEIYRPLVNDPKDLRRKRVSR